jgi:uncharacterized membrane protein
MGANARLRALLSGILLVGVGTAGSLIISGLVGALAVGWTGSLRGLPPALHGIGDFSGILGHLVELRPFAIAQAGLLVLLATPVLRVVVSLAAFTFEGDRLYAAITAVVLAILLTSIFAVR